MDDYAEQHESDAVTVEQRELFADRKKKAVLAVVTALKTGALNLSQLLRQRALRSRIGRTPNQHYDRMDWPSFKERLDDFTFRRYYRLGRDDFAVLLELLRPHLAVDETMSRRGSPSTPVTPELQLSMALRIFAGGSYLDIMLLHGVHRSTLYKSLWRVVDALNNTQELGLSFPINNQDGLRKLASDFQTERNSPFGSCVGALDGLVIEIVRPSVPNSKSYYNRKGFFGLPLQAMVDAHYKFLFASMKTTGSTHDAIGFAVSALGRKLARGLLPRPFWIAADAAYPASDYILTPHSGSHLSPDQDAFNFHLSRLRVTVEQAFGMLVMRFGILWRPLDLNFRDVPRLVMALIRLHNFCVDRNVVNAPRHADDRRPGDRVQLVFQDACHDIDDRRRRRRDLEKSALRDELTQFLRDSGQVRPTSM